MLLDGVEALCWAGLDDAERSLPLARRGVETARAERLDLPRIVQGTFRARVRRMVASFRLATRESR